MAKRSGSRSSRSERRAERERAGRAREHGLPERQIAPRARATTPEPDRAEASSDPSQPSAPEARGVPTVVKVIGAALLILVGVYFLSRQRDRALDAPAESVSGPTQGK